MKSILDPSFVFHGEKTHSDPSRFRARMEARRIAAQRNKTAATPAANVTPLPAAKRAVKQV